MYAETAPEEPPPVAKPKKATKPRPKVKPKVKKKAAKLGGVERYERLDMRLSKAEKAKIMAKARKTRRTITSVMLEAIEKLKV